MCRIGFASYWEHINSKKHLRQIKSSKANKHIHELCTSYRRANENSSPNPDLKHSQLPKKKKIAKPAKTEKAKTKESVYKKDDLIIRIPKSLLEKEQVFNCNMSTNGFNSLEPKEWNSNLRPWYFTVLWLSYLRKYREVLPQQIAGNVFSWSTATGKNEENSPLTLFKQPRSSLMTILFMS